MITKNHPLALGFIMVLVFSLPSVSLAETYGGGNGTAEDPYQIWTPEQMNTIGLNPGDWGKHFKLMADIDMSAYAGTQYNIIGNLTSPFTGTFDGNEHVISNLTYDTTESVNYVGLFGYTQDSTTTIQNVGVENVSLSTRGSFVGGLVGFNYGILTSCYSTGSVSGTDKVGGLCGQNNGTVGHSSFTGTVTGQSYTGGLCGTNSSSNSDGIIFACHASGLVTADGDAVGGLCGFNEGGTIHQSSASSEVIGFTFSGGLCGLSAGIISQSYAVGTLNGSICVGGLCGGNEDGITSSYARVSVTGYGFVGGLCGGNGGVITQSYSMGAVSGYENVGGLCGSNTNIISQSFWDVQTSGWSESFGGVGKTTSEMQTPLTYIDAGWDFDVVWNTSDDDYPRLSWGQSDLRYAIMYLSLEDDYFVTLVGSSAQRTLTIFNDGNAPLAITGIDMPEGFSGNWVGIIEAGESQEITVTFSPTNPQNFSEGQITVVSNSLFGDNSLFVHADGIENPFNGGDGTEGSPYQINRVDVWLELTNYYFLWDKHFILTENLDFQGATIYRSVGESFGQWFTGVFDGNGHIIRNFVMNQGLFGCIGGECGEIKNLGVESFTMYGGLCAENWGTITNCFAIGGVTIGVDESGGLCGCNYGTISQCYSTGSVSGGEWGGGVLGGLCGWNAGTINQCYSTGTVNGGEWGNGALGGLCGSNDGTISQCYSSGTVNGGEWDGGAFGGLCGRNEWDGLISQCYSTGAVSGPEWGMIGGLSGINMGTIDASFWDMNTSGWPSNEGGIGKTTAEMKTLSTFTDAGWDFAAETANGTSDIWIMSLGGYPVFLYQHWIVLSVNRLLIQEGHICHFDVHLRFEPKETVVLNLSIVGDGAFSVVTGKTLLFGPEDWNQPHTVTVQAGFDDNYLNDRAALVIRSDDYGAELPLQQIDIQPEPPHEIISVSNEEITLQEGEEATLTTMLVDDPMGLVEIHLSLSGDNYISISSDIVLFFDSNNYFVPQTITVKSRWDAGSQNTHAELLLSSPNLHERLCKTVTIHKQDKGARLNGTLPPGETVVSETQPVIFENVHIPIDSQLIIRDGTILKLDGLTNEIKVDGELVIQGAPNNPVLLTSYVDDTGGDTNSDGDATIPCSADWGGIILGRNGKLVLSHAIIDYASIGISTAGNDISNNILIDLSSVIVRNSQYQGIIIEHPFCKFTATNCIISDNGLDGIYLGNDSFEYPKTFRHCTITKNGWLGGCGGLQFGDVRLILESCVIAHNDSYALNFVGGYPDATIRYSNFYQAVGSVLIGIDMELLNQAGSVVADPLFVDETGGNYEPGIGSPLIDAGYASSVALTDIRGLVRHDDAGMPNLGRGVNWITDMGAFERQEDTAIADLAISYVSRPMPQIIEPDDLFSVNWSISNEGNLDYTGNWQEEVYLSDTPYLTPNDRLIWSETRFGPFDPNSHGYQSLTINMPLDVSGLKYLLVQIVPEESRSDLNTKNNIGCASTPFAINLSWFDVETPASGTLQKGQWHFYQFSLNELRTVRFLLQTQNHEQIFLYGAYEDIPAVSQYAFKNDQLNTSLRITSIPTPRQGNYYIGLYGNTAGSYTLMAEYTGLEITSVSPKIVGNAKSATLKIAGYNFEPSNTVELISSGNPVATGQVHYESPEVLYSTFDFTESPLTTGLYSLRVSHLDDPNTYTLGNAVTLQAGGKSDFFADLQLPGMARPGRVVSVQLTYGNRGTVDIFSPLLTMTGPQADCEWCLPGEETWQAGKKIRMMGLSNTGPVNILRPGQTETVTVRFRTPFNYRPSTISLSVNSLGAREGDGSTQLIEWNSIQENMRPLNVSEEVWNPFWTRLVESVGQTWADAIYNLGIDAAMWKDDYPQVYSWDWLFKQKYNQALAGNAPVGNYTCDSNPTGYSSGPIDIVNALGTDGKCQATLLNGPLGGDYSSQIKEVLEREKYSNWPYLWDFEIVNENIGTISILDNGIKEENGSAKAFLKTVLENKPRYYGDFMQNIVMAVVVDADYQWRRTDGYEDLPDTEIDYNRVIDYFAQAPHSVLYGTSLFDPIIETDNDLDPSKFLQALQYLSVADEDDIAVFYFAGHGYFDNTQMSGCFALNHGDLFGEQFSAVISNMNKNRHIKSIVLISDSCQSQGQMVQSTDYLTYANATTFDSYARGNTIVGGYFTHSLFDALEDLENDGNLGGGKDGHVSLFEAFESAKGSLSSKQIPARDGKDVIFLGSFNPFNWIQIIETNLPASPDHTISYVDTQDNWPFAWSKGEVMNHCPNPQNGTIEYCDSPSRPPTVDGVTWRAYFILAKWDGGTKIKLYKNHQWAWGFDISAPKPDGSGADGPERNPPDGPIEDLDSTDANYPIDPEDKFGPAGYDISDTPEDEMKRLIKADETISYRIEFWNHENAEVPAQVVTMRDTLDPSVWDLSTLEFTRIGFLKWDIELPVGTKVIDQRIDLRPDMDLVVDVTTTVNPETGLVMWRLQCRDPLTGDYPTDPMAGFLPPFNKDTGYEMGWMEFRVKPVPDMATGTVISNRAYGEFDDMGDWINNPAPKLGPWINTIDAGKPTSSMNPLPARSSSQFTLSWQGQDDDGGSGVVAYDIFMSKDGQPYTLWNTIEGTFTHFVGIPGSTYQFYSIARDGVGHKENKEPVAEAQTRIYLAGDFTNDDIVNIDDLVHFASCWLSDCPQVDLAPVNSPDGIINLLDIAELSKNWLKSVIE